VNTRNLVVGAIVASSVWLGCEKTPSKLEGTVSVTESSGGDGDNAALLAAVQKLDNRLKALEEAHKVGAPGSAEERVHHIEANLDRYEEALGFLDLAYAQQKRQQEAQEANEPDPTAIFAVDFSGAVKAGQVEGPNSATVTVVEAWDFA